MAILTDQEIADKLTALVRDKELTRESVVKLSADTGASQRRIRAWLNGKTTTRVPKVLRSLCNNLSGIQKHLKLSRWIGKGLTLGAVGLWVTEMWDELGWETSYTFKRSAKDNRCIVTAKHPIKGITIGQEIATTDVPGIYLITTVYPKGAVLSCFLNCKDPLLVVQAFQDQFLIIKGATNGRARIGGDGASGQSACRDNIEREGAVSVCKWRDRPAAIDKRVASGRNPSGGYSAAH